MLQVLIDLEREERRAEISLVTRVAVFALAFAALCFGYLFTVGG
jgi:hypothetical protein